MDLGMYKAVLEVMDILNNHNVKLPEGMFKQRDLEDSLRDFLERFFEDGHEEGYDVGYDVGYDDGYESGYTTAQYEYED
jgi:hypothetical protein